MRINRYLLGLVVVPVVVYSCCWRPTTPVDDVPAPLFKKRKLVHYINTSIVQRQPSTPPRVSVLAARTRSEPSISPFSPRSPDIQR